MQAPSLVSATRKIAVLTVGRSDFGRYRPILRALRDDASVTLRLLVGGNHHSPMFGETVREIIEGGFAWEPGLEMAVDSDTPARAGKTIGLGTLALTQALVADRPDLLVLFGDRYEMLSGAAAAVGLGIPIVHIHGGAVTEGAIDEQIRHALTKMSHLHLVSCEEYARRVRQMGEEDWRVHVTGAPGLDELPNLAQVSKSELSEWLGLDLGNPTLLISFHPVTLEGVHLGDYIATLLSALHETAAQIVLTYPNSDPGYQLIISSFKEFAKQHEPRARIVDNAGTSRFASLMSCVSAMVGNSSAGIVEAPTFGLPVVNIGTRQDGKVKARNVIDCGYSKSEIVAAIAMALSPAFRQALQGLVNPHGDGKAGPRIGQILKTVTLDNRLLRKKFVDR